MEPIISLLKNVAADNENVLMALNGEGYDFTFNEGNSFVLDRTNKIVVSIEQNGDTSVTERFVKMVPQLPSDYEKFVIAEREIPEALVADMKSVNVSVIHSVPIDDLPELTGQPSDISKEPEIPEASTVYGIAPNITGASQNVDENAVESSTLSSASEGTSPETVESHELPSENIQVDYSEDSIDVTPQNFGLSEPFKVYDDNEKIEIPTKLYKHSPGQTGLLKIAVGLAIFIVLGFIVISVREKEDSDAPSTEVTSEITEITTASTSGTSVESTSSSLDIGTINVVGLDVIFTNEAWTEIVGGEDSCELTAEFALTGFTADDIALVTKARTVGVKVDQGCQIHQIIRVGDLEGSRITGILNGVEVVLAENLIGQNMPEADEADAFIGGNSPVVFNIPE